MWGGGGYGGYGDYGYDRYDPYDRRYGYGRYGRRHNDRYDYYDSYTNDRMTGRLGLLDPEWRYRTQDAYYTDDW